MHNAPAVSYPVGRSRFQAQLLLGVSVVTVLVWLMWALNSVDLTWLHAVAVACFGVVYPAVWLQWLNSPLGKLSWCGDVWRLDTGKVVFAVSPVVVLDAQFAMLLRLQHADRAWHDWAWVEQSALSARWTALRRALVQRHIRVGADHPQEPDVPTAPLERAA